MIHGEGYERMVRKPSPTAVRWWFFHEEDGYSFARGGLVRTARIARQEIARAREQLKIEREARAEALRQLNAKKLRPDGSLE